MFKLFFLSFILLCELRFTIIITDSRAAENEIFFEEVVEKLSTQTGSLMQYVFQYEEDYSKQIHLEVKYFLLTREDKSEVQLFVNDHETLEKSTFNKSRPSIIIVHGFTDSMHRKIIVKLRNSVMENFDVNIIMVDWSRLARQIYFTVVTNIYSIGKFFGTFLQFLEDAQVDLSTLHLIGHSLGAQICGIAGSQVNSKIGRITGLDPAGPLFDFISLRNNSESLHAGQAQFVDVIHTAVNNFGIISPVGHVDFYPNDGAVPQPGCDNILLAVTCSHVRSIKYFAESFNTTNPFMSKKCKNITDEGVPFDCSNVEFEPMGYYTPTRARGIYYLQTRGKPPYSLGKKFYKRKPPVVDE